MGWILQSLIHIHFNTEWAAWNLAFRHQRADDVRRLKKCANNNKFFFLQTGASSII